MLASEERLEQCLGLKKGAVTPLGLIHESGRAVKVLFDRDLKGLERAGFHPNDNHATVFLRFQDLCRLLEAYGHPCRFLTV
ncbi:MAG: YbaK/EbsC family protein [Acutalibacteraceae bacterium]